MFENQVVWITGSSSGIGEALALQFAEASARLVLSSRREKELNRVRNLCLEAGVEPDQVLVLPLDVTDYDAMQPAMEQIMGAFGRIDMLINNAGISQRAPCVETDLSIYRQLMETDVIGQIAMTKAVLPQMLKQGEGHIAVTSSVAGKVGAPHRTGYCAAKHALMGFFDSLRAEVTHQGIRVTTITPGFILTNIAINALQGDGTDFGRTDRDIAQGMDVNQAAKVIMKGFRKGIPEIAVGKGREMHALWLKRLFPRLLMKITANLPRPE